MDFWSQMIYKYSILLIKLVLVYCIVYCIHNYTFIVYIFIFQITETLYGRKFWRGYCVKCSLKLKYRVVQF